MDFTDLQIERYARHILLKEIGGAGQQKLLNARVLVVGAGGLGAPVLMYLAAAGVGTLGIIDDDEVALSNLQRQIIHSTADLGRAKTASARDKINALNSDVEVKLHPVRLTAENALAVICDYDIIADGSDNFETRFLLNDACYLAHKLLVSAAVGQFDGQLTTFKAYQSGAHPCYRCLYPAPPPAGLVPTCAEGGIIGALTGVLGSMQAIEIIKEITGAGAGMSGRLLVYDALQMIIRVIKIPRDPACALCSSNATIHELAPIALPEATG